MDDKCVAVSCPDCWARIAPIYYGYRLLLAQSGYSQIVHLKKRRTNKKNMMNYIPNIPQEHKTVYI